MKLELSEVNLYQCIILEVPDVLQIHFRRNSEPLGDGWSSEGALGSSSAVFAPSRSWPSVFFLLRVPREERPWLSEVVAQ